MKITKALLLAMTAFSADAKPHQVRGKDVVADNYTPFTIEIPRGTKYEDIDSNVRRMLQYASVDYMDCMQCSCDNHINGALSGRDPGPTCTCDDSHCNQGGTTWSQDDPAISLDENTPHPTSTAPIITPATPAPTAHPTVHPTPAHPTGKGKGKGGKGKGKGKAGKGNKRYGKAGKRGSSSYGQSHGKGKARYDYDDEYSSFSSYDGDDWYYSSTNGKGGKGHHDVDYYDDDYSSGKGKGGKRREFYYDDDYSSSKGKGGKGYSGKGMVGKGSNDDDDEWWYDDDESGDDYVDHGPPIAPPTFAPTIANRHPTAAPTEGEEEETTWSTDEGDDHQPDDEDDNEIPDFPLFGKAGKGKASGKAGSGKASGKAGSGEAGKANGKSGTGKSGKANGKSGKVSEDHVSSDGSCPTNCETVTYDCMSDGCNVWCYCPDPEWEAIPDAIIPGKGKESKGKSVGKANGKSNSGGKSGKAKDATKGKGKAGSKTDDSAHRLLKQ